MPGLFDSLLGTAQAAPQSEDEQIKALHQALFAQEKPQLAQSLGDALAGLLPVLAASGVAGGRYGDIGAQAGQNAMQNIQAQRNAQAEQRRRAMIMQLGALGDSRKEARMDKRSEDAARRQAEVDAYRSQRDEVKDAQWQKQFELSQAKLDAMAAKDQAGGQALTKGQIEADKAFGKDYADWSASGGYKGVANDIKKLREEVLTKLNPKDASNNPIAGAIARSDLLGSALTPGRVAIQDNIASVIQKNLRKTLGAQFTEKEGELLIRRAYNPQLSDAENYKRVNLVLDQLEAMAKEKEAAEGMQQKAKEFVETGSEIYHGNLPDGAKVHH